MRSYFVALLVAVSVAFTSPSAYADGLFGRKQVLFDEDLVVSSGGYQSRGFELTRRATVEVEVRGLKNTDKGFDSYVMSTENYERFSKGKAFEHFNRFQGLKISGSTNTGDLAAGSYTLVVQNKYNLMRGMTVHVRVTVNP